MLEGSRTQARCILLCIGFELVPNKIRQARAQYAKVASKCTRGQYRLALILVWFLKTLRSIRKRTKREEASHIVSYKTEGKVSETHVNHVGGEESRVTDLSQTLVM